MEFDLRGFKKYVKRKFPENHPLQVVQFESDDFLDDDKVILAKVGIWLQLAELKR